MRCGTVAGSDSNPQAAKAYMLFTIMIQSETSRMTRGIAKSCGQPNLPQNLRRILGTNFQ